MKTLFMGSYGFGNLGDELCLIEALQAFPSSEVWAFSANETFTRACVPEIENFISDRREIQTLKPQRVILGGGGVGFFPSIRDSLHWIDDAFRLGAECHIHNIGVARMDDLSWVRAVQVQRVLRGMSSCSVRDDMSWCAMVQWPAQMVPISITKYPETGLMQDATLAELMPRDRKLLGVSITGQKLMRDALREHRDRVVAKLLPYRGYSVVPIISTVSLSDPEEDDVAGFEVFRSLFLSDFEICNADFLDKGWWRENMTPLRLKGLIGGLDVLFTQRKHNLIHAIGTQTPVVGIYPTIDDSIARIFFTLRGQMPIESSQLAL